MELLHGWDTPWSKEPWGVARRRSVVPKAYPKDFRDDVVAVSLRCTSVKATGFLLNAQRVPDSLDLGEGP